MPQSVVAAELAAPVIGAADIRPGRAGVDFRGSLYVGYNANLWLRSAVRVLVRLAAADLDIEPARPSFHFTAWAFCAASFGEPLTFVPPADRELPGAAAATRSTSL